jgi:hypothetical protein
MRWRTLVVAVVLLASPRAALAETPDDRFVAGYAAAVLERELRIRDAAIEVRDGVVTVRAAGLSDRERAAVRDALATIPGIARVDVLGEAPPPPAAPPLVAAPGEAPPPAAAPAEAPAPDVVVARTAPAPRGELLPRGQLFRALVADPRWPRFSATYRYYLDDDRLESVGSANFGATIPLYRRTLASAGRWDAGLQAGVFSIFDLDADSKDLINADYFVALFGSYAIDDFAVLGRRLHHSSHLGDEFLLRGRVNDRVNLSYEAVDLKLAYDLFDGAVRLYGGAGFLFDQEPASLDAWTAQYGVELTSPWPVDPSGAVTPIVAADVQHQEETAWSTQYSLLAGVRFDRVRIGGGTLLLAGEWFRGHSPNGQFYRQKVEWVGAGLHLFF